MREMTGGEAVVATLQCEGVEAIFGIPGTYNLSVYDALYATPPIRHVLACHEGGAAMMADGYARASGRPGVCLTIAGPGATNALTGLVTAHAESSPVLMVATEIDKALIGLDRGVSHEIKQQLDVFRAALVSAVRADTVPAIPPAIHQAMAVMRRGRPRPTYVEVPWDVLGERGDVRLSGPAPVEKPAGEPVAIEAAARLLEQAERPLIFSGVGTLRAGASAELRRVAEALNCPVITTAGGKGSLPEDHPCALGAGVGRNPVLTGALARADVVLAVGTSFDTWSMQGWTLEVPRRLIRIDIAAEQLQKNYPPEIAIRSDARLALAQLAAALPAWARRDRAYAADLKVSANAARAAAEAAGDAGPRVVRQLRAALPRDAILTVDLAMILQWIAWNFEVYTPNGLLLPWNSATLGFALPAALGAQIAWPERAVVALVGDGGFLFTGQELLTAAQHDLPVVTIVFNNRAHGSIKKQQASGFGGRYLGVDLAGPDFMALAQAFGVRGERVETPDALGACMQRALEARAPTLLEVRVGLQAMNHPWVVF
ncbi:MAG: thiamine pyrophosphate-binding protein [Ardenticatenaceae bacterium]|nr:thiamine pyrophosphate-binding protein [Ardenticatenaceae bacterium]